MIQTLYIHAGSHKTGTTSIQKFLKDNREELKQRYDLLLPNLKGMLKLTPSLQDYGLFPYAFQPLRSLDCSKAVISRENFSWVDDKVKLIKLKKELDISCQNIKIVFYIRRQDSLAISQKQEGTKWIDCSIAYGHETKALPSELSEVAFNYLNFYRKISMWADVFGDENIIIRIFEKGSLFGNDAVKDFCHVLDINSDDLKLQPPVNESLKKSSQLFLHQTRDVFLEGTKEKELLVKYVRKIDKSEPNVKLLPSKEEAYKFYCLFKESNIMLNERFSISSVEKDIFSNDFSMYPDESNEEQLTNEQVNAFFFKIMSSFSEYTGDSEKQFQSIFNDLKDIERKLPARSPIKLSVLELAVKVNPKARFLMNKIKKLRAFK